MLAKRCWPNPPPHLDENSQCAMLFHDLNNPRRVSVVQVDIRGKAEERNERNQLGLGLIVNRDYMLGKDKV